MDIAAWLDQALDQPTASRAGWLARLAEQDAAVAARLGGLLQRLASTQGQGFLAEPAPLTGPAEPVAVERQPGQRLGPWALLAPLGRGGMAEVWRAERADGAYQREVALKLPLVAASGPSREMAARFERERDVLASLVHPGIARFYEAGLSEGGTPWLAMELASGRPLCEAADALGLGLRERVEVLIQACAAVQHAHSRLVVHRDLKPANMLLDDGGQLRLLDFGIAKLLATDATELTRLGASPLTLGYAAPEQLQGGELGTACDIYGLGMVACKLLAGATPFEHLQTTPTAQLAAVLQGASRRPSDLAADPARRRALRGDLDAIVLKALRPEPGARYLTAQALLEDLQRWQDGLPVAARPAHWRYVTGRWLRRHWRLMAVTASAALALAASTAWALDSARSEREQAARATAMLAFFRQMLSPDGSGMSDLAHRDRRVGELIGQMAERLPAAMPEAPEARWQLMRDLAPMVDSLGRREAALHLLDAQHAQAAAALGADSVEAALPLTMLAQLRYEAVGDFAGAYRLVRQARDTFAAQGTPDPSWLGVTETLTGYYGWRSRQLSLAQGIEAAERAAALLRRHPETDSLANDALSLLAIMRREQGRDDLALAAAREGIAFNLQRLGRNNWHTSELMSNAALTSQRMGLLEEAEHWMRQADEIDTAVWPQGNFLHQRDLAYLGQTLLWGTGREEGLQLLERARQGMRRPEWKNKLMHRNGVLAAWLEGMLISGQARRVVTEEPSLCAQPMTEGRPENLFTQAQRCAQLHLQLGAPDEAQRWLERGRALMQQHQMPASRGAWLALRASELAQARGQTQAAATARQAALALAAPQDWFLRAELWRDWQRDDPASLPRARLAADAQALAGRQPHNFAHIQTVLREALAAS